MLPSCDTKSSTVIPVVIAAKYDGDNVLANIMDVSFHRRYHQRSNIRTVLSNNITIIVIINNYRSLYKKLLTEQKHTVTLAAAKLAHLLCSAPLQLYSLAAMQISKCIAC